MSVVYTKGSEFDHFVDLLERDGYVVIDDVFNPSEISEIREEIRQIVDEIDVEQVPKKIFTTTDEEKHINDRSLIDSVDRIAHFFEQGSIDPADGQLLVPKQFAFNKIGHALHWLNSVFKRYTFDERIKRIAKVLRLKSPKIVQSMYIFKQPKLRTEHENSVKEHADSFFLHSEPDGKVFGVWIAIDDATLDNGCLWFVPGSHRTDEYLRQTKAYCFQRISKSEASDERHVCLGFTGIKPEYNQSGFKPVEVKKGSLVLIHGDVVHKSETNLSALSRHAYTFHMVESDGVKWGELNWLQETDSYKFPLLYEN